MLTPDEIAPEQVRPLRRSEYERLVAMGAFEDEHVELLHGVLVQMSPQDPRHAFAVRQLMELLFPGVPEQAMIQCQSPLAMGEMSQPEPDLAVVPRRDYRTEHPDRALLVIEVAGSSLRKDRDVKGALYASAGVPEYWIVNLDESRLEIHREPGRKGYGTRQVLGPEDQVTPVELPRVTLRVGDFLP